MKLDLLRTNKTLYSAGPRPQLITVPEGRFIAITGQGAPLGLEYAHKVQALYMAAYSIRHLCRQRGQDFTVSKLEGLWWINDPTRYPLDVPQEEWCWQQLIRMPEFVTQACLKQAVQEAFAKKPLPVLQQVKLITLEEGLCVQVLHAGPYSNERITLEQMYEFMELHRLEWNGRHHEIYLTDPRRTAPEKARTILRQPVKQLLN